MSLDLTLPNDWRSWDEPSKARLIARLKAEAIEQGRAEHFCEFETPSQMARHYLGDRWHQRNYHNVLDQLALDLDAGVIDRATLSQPPQTGKSTGVNWLLKWWAARHPTHPMIRMSYAAELATSHSRVVQQFVEDHGGDFGLLPRRGSWAQNNWITRTGAGVRSGGMLTGVAGFPAALLVIDDPFAGRAHADSKLIRDKTYDEYSGSLLTRLRPGSPLLIINTRWHEDDINARVIKLEGRESEGGRWREINLAALAREDDYLGRSEGEPLQHPWIEVGDVEGARKHWEDKRATVTLRDWHSQYQGDPKPVEGALLSEAQVTAATHIGELPEAVKTGVAVDPSGGGRDTFGIVGGMVDAEGIVYWTHDLTERMSSEKGWRAVCLLAYELEANDVVVEHNYGGDTGKLLFRTTWAALQNEGEIPTDAVPPRVTEIHAKKGKRVRAEPIAAQVQLGRIKFWGLKVLKVSGEWVTWQEDSKESPGRIDASSYLAYRWLKIPGVETIISTIASEAMPKQGTGKGALTQVRVTRPVAGR